jgi:hypothetical protein
MKPLPYHYDFFQTRDLGLAAILDADPVLGCWRVGSR